MYSNEPLQNKSISFKVVNFFFAILGINERFSFFTSTNIVYISQFITSTYLLPKIKVLNIVFACISTTSLFKSFIFSMFCNSKHQLCAFPFNQELIKPMLHLLACLGSMVSAVSYLL